MKTLWRPIIVLTFLACVSPDSGPAADEAGSCANDEVSVTDEPTSIALSGGGYRAMLFHVGALWRLNEAGILAQAETVSSVSGGSILAGILAANWERLGFDSNGIARCYEAKVAQAAIELAGETIDWKAIGAGILPMLSAAGRMIDFYANQGFGKIRLADLVEHPRFIINATNLQTGQVWQFTKEVIGDDAVGYTPPGDITLAVAIAASSAYPPYLSPLVLDLQGRDWLMRNLYSDDWDSNDVHLYENPFLATGQDQTTTATFRDRIYLTDGGIADNLGLVSILRDAGRILVSDGGAGLDVESPVETGIVEESMRAIDIIFSQPSELRAKVLIDPFKAERKLAKMDNKPLERDGVYWSIRGPIYRHKDVPVQNHALSQSPHLKEEARALAEIETRLAELDQCKSKRLINWGYFIVDNALPFLDSIWFSGPERKFQPYKLSDSLPYQQVGFGDSSGSCG